MNAEVIKVNLREVPIKSAIHTIYAMTLKQSIVIAPQIINSQNKITVDVLIDKANLQEFADAFIESQGITYRKKGGALVFDMATANQNKSTSENTPQTSHSHIPPTGPETAQQGKIIKTTDQPTNLDEIIGYSPDCWLSSFSDQSYSITCLDGRYYHGQELQRLKPTIDHQLKEVKIGKVTYRNRTPASFFSSHNAKSTNRITEPHQLPIQKINITE